MVETLIIPDTSIHLTHRLISPVLNKLIDEKINLFRKENMQSAGLAEIVGKLTGYDFIITDRHCGGYCSPDKKIIALKDVSDWKTNEVRHLKGKILPITVKAWQQKTMMHEIGHAIQAEAELFEKLPRLFSSAAQMEWQAESIAYRLMNACYYHMPHEYFSSYFEQQHLIFLQDWYEGWIQNDVNLKR